jgi:methylmalonyl-CoA mutase cobalamin-binding subunit
MNIEVGRDIAKSAFRSTRELGNLILDLKGKLSADEHQSYAKAIATAIAGIQINVLNKAAADCPGLEEEIERAIEKTGSYS